MNAITFLVGVVSARSTCGGGSGDATAHVDAESQNHYESQDALDHIRDSFVNELGRNPDQITKRLASFDEPTLNMLLPKNKRRIVQEAGRQWDELFSSEIETSLRRQSRVRGFVKNLVAGIERSTMAMKDLINIFRPLD